jgi:hypothetical protein
MKNTIFWNIKIQFVPHRRHITSLLQRPAVNTMEDLRFSRRWLWRMLTSGMLCRVAPVRTDVSEECSSSIIRNHQKCIVFLRSVRRLLDTANVVPSSPIRITLITEALGSSETWVLRRATRRSIPEDGILRKRRSSCWFPAQEVDFYLRLKEQSDKLR